MVYVMVGGFRATGQVDAEPVALPDPWVTGTTPRSSARGVLAAVRNSVLIAAIATVVSSPSVRSPPMRSLGTSSGAGGRSTRSSRSGCCSRWASPSSRSPLPAAPARAARQPPRRGDPRGGVRVAGHDRDPATVRRQMPTELEDAAAIDGCSRFVFFWRILVPLSRPALMTVAVLAVVTSWNSTCCRSSCSTTGPRSRSPRRVPVLHGVHAGHRAVLAFTALSMVPALAFFVFAGRRIVGGLSERSRDERRGSR